MLFFWWMLFRNYIYIYIYMHHIHIYTYEEDPSWQESDFAQRPVPLAAPPLQRLDMDALFQPDLQQSDRAACIKSPGGETTRVTRVN